MFGMGMGELILILIVALLVLGPNKLPDAAKAIGKGIRELRRHTRDLQETLEKDEQLGSTVRELKSVLRGDEIPPAPRAAPPPPGTQDQGAASAVAVAEDQPAPSTPGDLPPSPPAPDSGVSHG
ncbi:MAG: twin-arginine translocase TatA/TatE family subunit [Deltaproteobacteria bacterium]|nr:twin-arginine translocase TatA/TatE family subunit [Deltaproteobacteria bacterium]